MAGSTTAKRFSVQIDDTVTPVARLSVGSLVGAVCSRAPAIRIEPSLAFERVVVRPVSRGIDATIDGSQVTIHLDETRAAYLSVEFDGDLRNPLFVFIDSPDVPLDRNDPSVRYLESGAIHDLPDLRLECGQTPYIEVGVLLRGNIIAEKARGIEFT